MSWEVIVYNKGILMLLIMCIGCLLFLWKEKTIGVRFLKLLSILFILFYFVCILLFIQST